VVVVNVIFYYLGPSVDHSDLHFAIQKDGLGGYGRTEKGFAYLWAGSRATWGCKDGRYCFECKVCNYSAIIKSS